MLRFIYHADRQRRLQLLLLVKWSYHAEHFGYHSRKLCGVGHKCGRLFGCFCYGYHQHCISTRHPGDQRRTFVLLWFIHDAYGQRRIQLLPLVKWSYYTKHFGYHGRKLFGNGEKRCRLFGHFGIGSDILPSVSSGHRSTERTCTGM
jgi:hypothetical protein